MTQSIGAIRVGTSQPVGTVSANTIGTVKVQVGQQQGGTVRSISYGNRSIKGSSDLSMSVAEDGDAVIYQANTNSFVVAPVSAKGISSIKGGTF